MRRPRKLHVEPLLHLDIKHFKGRRWPKLIKIHLICHLFCVFLLEGPKNITINRGEIPFSRVFSHLIPARQQGKTLLLLALPSLLSILHKKSTLITSGVIDPFRHRLFILNTSRIIKKALNYIIPLIYLSIVVKSVRRSLR